LRPIAIARSFCPCRHEVEVHYRWHALYGRRVRRQYAERRAGGEVAHVEVAPGVVIVVAAWILDPAACAGMAIGAPRVTVSALADLHQLLIEHGFRRSSPDDPTIPQRSNMRKLPVLALPSATPSRSARAGFRGWAPRIAVPCSPGWPASYWRPPASRLGSVTMTSADLLPATVLKRKAVVYIRQSTQAQVQTNLESQRRQYELVDVARRRGFRDVEVI
jgi:hypothetical protein